MHNWFFIAEFKFLKKVNSLKTKTYKYRVTHKVKNQNI